MFLKDPRLIPLVRARIVERRRTMPRHGDREFETIAPETYAMPCDETEQRRMLARHRFWKKLMGGRLFTAPYLFETEDNKIIDLGCGSASWAVDMASYTNASEIFAVDMSNIQPRPTLLSPRIKVRHMDYETAPWSFLTSHAGLIYLRCASGSVSDYPSLYQTIYDNLKPGVGYFEQVEIDFQPWKYGDVARRDLATWWFNLCNITRSQRRPIEFNHGFREQLEQAGFADIKHESIMIPMSSTLPSPNPHIQAAKEQLMELLPAWIESIMLGPYMRYLGVRLESVRVYTQRLVDWFVDPEQRHSTHVHIITARRPNLSPSPILLAADTEDNPFAPHAESDNEEVIRALTTHMDALDEEILIDAFLRANPGTTLSRNEIREALRAGLITPEQNTLSPGPLFNPHENELDMQDTVDEGQTPQDPFMDGLDLHDPFTSEMPLADPFENGLGEDAIPISPSPPPTLSWDFGLD